MIKENIFTCFALYGVISFTRDIIFLLSKNKYFKIVYKDLEEINEISDTSSETSSVDSLIIINDSDSENETLRKRRRK